MRQVIGKATHDLDAGAFAELRAGRPLLLDLGTGDGKHVLTEARADAGRLVVGLDAGPDNMRKTALKAAAKPAKGGTPNAVFVWASAESLPVELGEVGELHCLMPWGSLLRALVTPDVGVLRGIAKACTPGAPFLITLNLHAWRPPVSDVGDTAEPTPQTVADELTSAYADAGWRIESASYPDASELDALGTSWTKRLGSSRDELAVLALRGTIGES